MFSRKYEDMTLGWLGLETEKPVKYSKKEAYSLSSY